MPKKGVTQLVLVMIVVVLTAAMWSNACATDSDSVTVSVALLDSTLVHIDGLELSLSYCEISRDSALAVMALNASGKPPALPDSFWRKWYVWATLYGLGVLTGVLVW